MSQDLINFAARGDFEKLKKLLNDPNVDINYVGEVLRGKPEKHNALTAAILHSHWDIAKFLLEQSNIQLYLDSKKSEIYLGLETEPCSSVLEWLSTDRYPKILPLAYEEIFINVLGLILRKSSKINPKTKEPFIKTLHKLHYNENLKTIYTQLFFYEAIYRDDRVMIKDIFEIEDLRRSCFARNSFKKYLKLHDFFSEPSHQMIATILDCVEQLAAQYGYQDHIIEMKKILESHTVLYQFLESVPDMLPKVREYLSKSTNRTLYELISEFIHWIYNQEITLPVLPLDHPAMQKMGRDYGTSDDQIKEYQHPKYLRALLEKQDDSMLLLARLNACWGKNNHNLPALILAEILLYKHQEKIKIDEKEEVFLTPEHLKSAWQILKHLYSLQPPDRILLTFHYETHLQMMALREQNQSLFDQNKQLKEQVDLLTQKCQLNEKKIDQATVLLEQLTAKLLANHSDKEIVQQSESTFKLFN